MSKTKNVLTATRTGSPGALAAHLRSGGGTMRSAQKHKHSKGGRRAANASIRGGNYGE